jgi:homoserine/homoserine lactone efflux protein
MNWHLFAGFLFITVVLLLTPGPIVTLVISTGATRGVRAALVTVAGTSTGNALLLTAIALGLNWVLGHAVYLFELLRWLGVAYLLWLGVRAWRSAGRPVPPAAGNQVHFWRGLLVALSNPKTLAFFTAFLPQFVDAARPAAPQLAVMCRHGAARRVQRFLLGHRVGPGARLVHATRACAAPDAHLSAHAHRRRHLVVAGAATGVSRRAARALLSSDGALPHAAASFASARA